DVDRLAAFEQFTAVISALEVGLDGSVNVEVLDGRPVAGIGGHRDFCTAAARSPGGLSIVALTAARRGRSTIVPAVERVSTPGDLVHLVVTEYGVADLRGADGPERRRRLTAVASPPRSNPSEGARACQRPPPPPPAPLPPPPPPAPLPAALPPPPGLVPDDGALPACPPELWSGGGCGGGVDDRYQQSQLGSYRQPGFRSMWPLWDRLQQSELCW